MFVDNNNSGFKLRVGALVRIPSPVIRVSSAVQDFNSWQHIFTGPLISNILYKQSPHFSTDSYGVNWRPCWQGSLSGVAGSHLLETNNWVLGLFIMLTGKCPLA